MNKYGQAALKAVELIHLKKATTPINAWEMATIEVFGLGTPSQSKGCPKNTFLALCETGKVKGVKAGTYTRSEKNKGYAIKALAFISRDPSLAKNPSLLWEKIMCGVQKVHNSQMNVVVALWNSDSITTEVFIDDGFI